jgi:hypothetical protein
MENVFEPMNFDGEVFEPMNFDGEVFEQMNFDGSSSDSVYFDGEEYSNFISFKVLKKKFSAPATPKGKLVKTLGKVASAPFKVAGAILKAPISAVKSIIRKEPSVRINATVVPAIKQSIITGKNNKPFVVTPLDSRLKPIGRPFFPIKNQDVVISQPIPKNEVKPMNIKEISTEVSKSTGTVVEKPSVLTPSQISVVTETIVKDNNNKPFLITPINSVKSDEFKEDSTKPNVVISINDKDLPKPIDAKNEEGKNIQVATAINEDIVKPKEEVVPSTNLQTTPTDAPKTKSNKKLYIGIGLVALAGIVGYFVFKKK